MKLLAVAWRILSSSFIRCFADGTTSIGQLTYSGTQLLGLRDSGVLQLAVLLNDVPREL